MANDNKDAAGQLDIQNQINKVLQQRNEILKAQSKYLTGQVQIAMEMCNAMNCESLDGMEDRLNGIQDGLKQAANDAKELESGATGAGGAINRMASGGVKQGGALNKVFSPMGGMFIGLGGGIVSAFKGAQKQMSGFIASAGRIPGIIGNVGKALIMTPFSLLNNLTSYAAGAGGGVSALRTQMEDLKETFGSLASNEGKAVMDGFNDMRSAAGDLGGSGVSMRRIFGPGQDGLAAALKSVGEQLSDLGPMMSMFAGEVSKNAGVFEVYRRGLGLTGDNFKALGAMAAGSGRSMSEVMGEVSNQAIQMGAKFGVSSKLVAQDMAAMAGDVAHFGNMGTKQLASMAVYARKLGIEAKELAGVVDKWDNFEDAAAGASKLSQAFGMNIDAMQMMNEQDPAKRLDMMRDSFAATGRSVEDLSRQELKLLASQMGLSEEAAKTALANQDMSYDDVVSGSEEAEEKQMSQAEAMKELADAMKQTFGGGGQGIKTFTEALVKGFNRGMKRGKGMRKMFRNIRGSMKEVYRFSSRLGKAFIDTFPGIQGMVKGLTKIFDPKRFKALGGELLGAFKDLFHDLEHDPKAGVQKFFDRIKNIFSNFFKGSGGGASMFMDGLKKFASTVAILLVNMVPIVIKGFAKVIQKIADWLANPSGPGTSKTGKAMAAAFSAAWQSIKESVPVLFGAIKNLIVVLFTKYKEPIIKIMLAYGSVVLGKALLVTALSAVKGAVVGKIASIFAGFFGKATASASKTVGGGTKAGGMGKALRKGFTGLAKGFKSFLTTISRISPTTIIKAGISMGLIAIMAGGSMILFAMAMVGVAKVLGSVSFGALAKGIFGLAGAAFALWVLLLATAPLIADGGITLGLAMLGMLAGALVLTVGGIAFALAMYAVTAAMSGLDPKKAAWAMGALAIAALATVGLFIGGAALGAMGPLAALAVVGMIAGALVLQAVGGMYIDALIAVGEKARMIKDPVGIAIGLVAIAVGMGAVALMMMAASAMSGVAIPALVGIVLSIPFLLLLPTAVEGLGLVAQALQGTGVDWIKVSLMFLSVAVIFGALVLMAASAALAGAASIAGVIGLVLAMPFLVVLPGFIDLLVASSSIISGSGLDWGKTSLQFLAISAIMATLAVLGTAATLAGPLALVGAVGLLLTIPFLALLPGFVIWMKKVAETGGDMDYANTAKGFASIAEILGYIALAGLAAVPAGIAGLIGAITMGGAVKFLRKLVEKDGFMDNVKKFSDAAKGALTAKTTEQTEALGSFFSVIGQAGALSIALLPFTMPFIGKILMGGFEVIGTFSDKIVKHFIPAAKAFSSIEISDPESMKAKMEVLGQVFGMVGGLAETAAVLATIDTNALSEGGKQGETINAATKMINALLGGTSKLIKDVVAIIGGFSEADMVKAAAAGKLFAGIGTMVQSMMPPPEFFNAIKKVTKSSNSGLFGIGASTSETTDVSGNAPAVIAAMAGFIDKMMGSVAKNIPAIVGAVVEAASAIPNDPNMEGKMKIVSMAIDMVGKFGKTMKDMSEMAKEMHKDSLGFGASFRATPISDTMGTFKEVVVMIREAMAGNMQAIIGAVIESANGISDPKALEPKMKLVATAMDIVSKFGRTIKDVQSLMPSDSEMPDVSYATRMRTMISTIRQIVDSAKTELPGLVQAVLDVANGIRNPRQVARRMKVVATAMDAVSKFASTLKDLKSLKGENDLGSVGDIMGSLVRDIKDVLLNNSDNLADLITQVSERMRGVSYRGIRNASRSMEKFSEFASKYADLARTAMAMPNVGDSSAGQAIVAMIQSYADVKAQLAATPVVGLSGTIDRFGQNLAISRENLQIQNTPININVQLNLTMDADQIAVGLSRDGGRRNVVQLSRRNGVSQPAE